MANTPGRLYRILEPEQPLFEFLYDGELITDDEIRSVSIHHGGDGVSPSTMEITTTLFDYIRTNSQCTLRVSDYTKNMIEGLAGSTIGTPERFTGRIGRQIINDRGGTDRDTTYFGASLTAQYPALSHRYNFTQGQFINHVVVTLHDAPSVPVSDLVTPSLAQDYGQLAEDMPDQSWSDMIGKVTTDLGLTFRTLRNGQSQLLTNEWRHSRAVDGLADAVPISRSQALAPTTWEQNNELTPRRILLTYIDGNYVEQNVTFGTDPIANTQPLDMSHARFTDDTQPWAEGRAARAREVINGYDIPEIEIDLLRLIKSPYGYDRWQAAKMLALHVNDHVYLSGDWHPNLQGISYAEEITETITKDAWTIKLKLLPSENVTGWPTPQSVPARTWAQADYPWADDSRLWGEA